MMMGLQIEDLTHSHVNASVLKVAFRLREPFSLLQKDSKLHKYLRYGMKAT